MLLFMSRKSIDLLKSEIGKTRKEKRRKEKRRKDNRCRKTSDWIKSEKRKMYNLIVFIQMQFKRFKETLKQLSRKIRRMKIRQILIDVSCLSV